MNNTYKITVGDWSDDGHGKTVDLTFTTNKTADEIRQGYWDSCVKTGVAFHHDDLADMENFNKMSSKADLAKIGHRILADYGEYTISPEVIDIFLSFGFDGEKGSLCVSARGLGEMILWFVGLSVEGFQWEASAGVESINGFWNNSLNVQFGYGLFG